ncbi:hypothetical protein V1478_007232 [Vespula squamosa]|uniref:Uncharacterized protein n=1 Tax=Vespula squamosa TaxID=30214 RepID=A0ABD2B2K0_VESSQ
MEKPISNKYRLSTFASEKIVFNDRAFVRTDPEHFLITSVHGNRFSQEKASGCTAYLITGRSLIFIGYKFSTESIEELDIGCPRLVDVENISKKTEMIFFVIT